MGKGKRKGGLFGGGGMPGSTQMLLKQASKVQAKIAENRERFSRLLFTGTAGGGALKVTVRGDFTVTDVSLDEDMYKTMSYEDMEDLIRGAVGEALKQIKNAENDSERALVAGAKEDMSESVSQDELTKLMESIMEQ